jgi:membrane protease YdiL (CAAX protease family)
MVPALVILGGLAEGVAWWVIARRGWSVWATMAPVLVALGLLALATGSPALAEGRSLGVVASVGLIAGLLLFGATRLFVAVVAPQWKAFRSQSVQIYGRRGAMSLGAVLVLSIGLMVPGEELFWRGLILPELERAIGGGAVAPVTAWAAFVAANLPSLNLAIVAGAAVGGAAWVALAAWSGGVLAALLCHAGWTALMLAFPPIAEPGEAIR